MSKVAGDTEQRPVVSLDCKVVDVQNLSEETFQILFEAPEGTQLQYHAGQYLQLELDLNNDGQFQSLFYTIANSCDPAHPRRLELFIHNASEFSGKIIQHLAQLFEAGASAKINLAMGNAYLQTDVSLPHVLIAAGSGISKIKCVTEEILRRNPDADVNIYWSNKSASDFYFLKEFNQWVQQHANLSFTPIVEAANDNWTGRSGYIYEVVDKDFASLDGAQVYLCGSPRMVYGTIDQLESKGLNEENCYSDVFEYAPREKKQAV